MLLLASTSPRRAALLTAAGIPFSLIAPGPEPQASGPVAGRASLRARSKAMGAQLAAGQRGWVLGVDTVVARRGREFGKPRDRGEAAAHLRALEGGEHEVLTALCLVRSRFEAGAVEPAREALAVARVYVEELAARRREAFLDSGAWHGKAGGYGVQDLECSFVHLVEGDLDTVVGLPVAVLRDLLPALPEPDAGA